MLNIPEGIAARWLRTTDAARYSGLSASTLTKLRLTGDGPPYAKAGRAVVYAATDIDEWLESRRRTSTSDSG